jgi:hypothetical protein
MRLQTYRDESRSIHFDLISEGAQPIDLVSVITAGMLVVSFASALIVPFTSTADSLSRWVL